MFEVSAYGRAGCGRKGRLSIVMLILPGLETSMALSHRFHVKLLLRHSATEPHKMTLICC